MARGIRVRINSAGARAVLGAIGVQADLMSRAEAISDRANGMVSADKMRNDAFMEDIATDGGRARGRVRRHAPRKERPEQEQRAPEVSRRGEVSAWTQNGWSWTT